MNVERRVTQGALVSASVLLMFCGVFALVTGRSPLAWLREEPGELRLHFEQERTAAAASNAGEFRVDADPRVGYTLRTSAELKTILAPYQTDEIGLRRRVGPPAAAGARTIALVGDSIAFGFGLQENECLAAQIEDALATIPIGARGGDGARDVICRTVAVPGWNWRNQCAFLLDHLDRLAPSFVLFLPIENDLADTDGVLETGQRRLTADVMAPDPLLFVSLARLQQNIVSYWPRVKQGRLVLTESDLGTHVLNADLGGESSRRYAEMTAELLRVALLLRDRGVRCAVAHYEDNAFSRALAGRLARAADPSVLPAIPLLDAVQPSDTLRVDPHPNAKTVAALAAWIAGDLVDELRWFTPGSAGVKAAVPAEFETRRAPRRAPDELERLRSEQRARDVASLKDEIVPETGRGIRQVYGGLTPAHGIGPRLLAALPRRSGRLVIEVAPLPARAEPVPFDLEVRLDGKQKVRATIGSKIPTKIEIDVDAQLDADGRAAAELDVELRASHWVTVEEFGGFELECARLTRIALLPR